MNPLSYFFQVPRGLPAPYELFHLSELPLHLDIGSARGTFLLKLAQIQKNWNYLGLEIRKPLVEAAKKEVEKNNLENISFLFCNANVSLNGWLPSLQKGLLQRVSIQFPDPWFKRRHRKRRVMQPELLISLAHAMKPGSELFVQTDILSLMEYMNKIIDLSNCFINFEENQNSFLIESPFPVSTEREQYVLEQGLPVYRRLYKRNSETIPDLESFWSLLKKLDEYF